MGFSKWGTGPMSLKTVPVPKAINFWAPSCLLLTFRIMMRTTRHCTSMVWAGDVAVSLGPTFESSEDLHASVGVRPCSTELKSSPELAHVVFVHMCSCMCFGRYNDFWEVSHGQKWSHIRPVQSNNYICSTSFPWFVADPHGYCCDVLLVLVLSIIHGIGQPSNVN